MMALSMFMVRYLILEKIFEYNNLHLMVSAEFFGLMVLSIILLAAGGNVINDITDIEADKINKPNINKVGNEISVRNATKYYYILTSLGLFLGLLINFLAGTNSFSVIHLFIGLSLWLYSNKLNTIPMVGNALISTLIAILPWIVTLYDLPLVLMKEVQQINGYSLMENHPINFGDFFTKIIFVILAYSLFSYVQNMARELVKDIIDVDGDRSAGYRTAPTIFGIPNTRKLIYVSYLILLTFQIAFILLLYLNFRPSNILWLILIGLCLFLPLFISLRKLSIATDKAGFKNLSQWNKISQFIGMLTMFYFYFLYS